MMKLEKMVKWFVGGSVIVACLLPAQPASAQVRTARGISGWLFDMKNYNVGIQGGIGDYGRFLLQNPLPLLGDFDTFNERELTTGHSWSLGGLLGITILPRVGARLSFNYTSANLRWRTDNGTGSTVFDVDDIGDLSHYTLGLEVIRYMLLETSRISPYASAGVMTTWWHMSEGLNLFAPDSETQFRWGGTGSVGVQFRMAQQWRIRLEANTASVGNPFSGRNSYVAAFGRTIDEPERVRKTDFRLGVGYAFGTPRSPLPATNGR